MPQHRFRLLLIAFAWLAALAALVAFVLEGITEGTGFGAVVSAVGLLTTAFVDAAAVERRRRAPGKRAIADDVA